MLGRIAIVAFKFPPLDEVGARRWAKLAKYMAAQGVIVDVFAAPWGAAAGSYDEDIDSPFIRVHRVDCPGVHTARAAARESVARARAAST